MTLRLLADENVPQVVVDLLREHGHDVLWARKDLPGWKDLALLQHAEREARVLLTLDKDFWQIAVQRRPPLTRCGVVLLRIHPATTENVKRLVRAFLGVNEIWNGHVSVVSTRGIQMLALSAARDGS